MNEIPLEISNIKTPTEIFRAIENHVINRNIGESLIKHYGDRRVREAMAELQGKMGIELTEEVGKRLNHIGLLIDEFHEKIIDIYPPLPEKMEEKNER